MKRSRGERETSEAFKQRGGVTADIERVKPKNVQNERQKDRDRGEEQHNILLHCQIYCHTEPGVD